jgi:hypothetical protein
MTTTTLYLCRTCGRSSPALTAPAAFLCLSATPKPPRLTLPLPGGSGGQCAAVCPGYGRRGLRWCGCCCTCWRWRGWLRP